MPLWGYRHSFLRSNFGPRREPMTMAKFNKLTELALKGYGEVMKSRTQRPWSKKASRSKYGTDRTYADFQGAHDNHWGETFAGECKWLQTLHVDIWSWLGCKLSNSIKFDNGVVLHGKFCRHVALEVGDVERRRFPRAYPPVSGAPTFSGRQTP